MNGLGPSPEFWWIWRGWNLRDGEISVKTEVNWKKLGVGKLSTKWELMEDIIWTELAGSSLWSWIRRAVSERVIFLSNVQHNNNKQSSNSFNVSNKNARGYNYKMLCVCVCVFISNDLECLQRWHMRNDVHTNVSTHANSAYGNKDTCKGYHGWNGCQKVSCTCRVTNVAWTAHLRHLSSSSALQEHSRVPASSCCRSFISMVLIIVD